MLQPIQDNIYMLVLKKEPDADYDQLALEVVHYTEAGERDVINLFTGEKAEKLLKELFTRLPSTTPEPTTPAIKSVRFDAYLTCETILTQLKADATTWGLVSVNDYYIRAGIDPTRDGGRYGWISKDLLDARIFSDGDQYELWFPSCRALSGLIKFSCAKERKPTTGEYILEGLRSGLGIDSPSLSNLCLTYGRKNGRYSYKEMWHLINEQAKLNAEINQNKESEKQDEV